GPVDRGAVECGAAERNHAVDIEFGCFQLRIEPRRLGTARARIGEAPFDGLVVELEFEALDRKLLRADVKISADAQQPARACRRIGAPFEPGGEHPRLVRLDLYRPLEADAVGVLLHAAAEANLREA